MIRWRSRLVGAASNRTFVVLVAATLGLVLTFHIARQVQDQEYQQRALTLAQSIAAIPEVDYLVSIDDPNHQLQELATQIVMRTNNSMKLEDQENTKQRIEKAIQERAIAIKNEMPKTLWDSI